MKPQFKYFRQEDAVGITDFSKALNRLAQGAAIIDANYLIVMEAAERGLFTAMCEMAIVFSEGSKGAPVNYRLAKGYQEAILQVNQATSDFQVVVESLKNFGLLERNFGNLEAAKAYFVEAIQLMTTELPPEKWDFSIFSFLYDLTIIPSEQE